MGVRYRAAAFDSPEPFRHRWRRLLIVVAVEGSVIGIGGLILFDLGYGTAMVVASALFLSAAASLLMGRYGLPQGGRRSYRLEIDGARVTLGGPEGVITEVEAASVQPILRHNSAWLGGHFEQAYFELQLPAPGRGPRTLFFEHDGDYMRKAFGRQGLTVLDATVATSAFE